MPEVITIGESMAMLIAEEPGPMEHVEKFSRHLAGAESNVAIGLARLGHKSGWISAVGEDPFGSYVVRTIQAEGVDTSAVFVSKQYPTGFMLKERNSQGDPKVYYYRRYSAASCLSADMVPESYFCKTKILHITGIFPALSIQTRKTLFETVEFAKKRGVFISFDPNVRLQLWSEEEAKHTLLEIAGLSDLILPGLSEAKLLIGTNEWPAVADFFHKKGNKIVVMKDGPAGAYYSVKEEPKGYEKGFKVESVVDTVGAGDGFAVGVLSGLLDDLTVSKAVERGNAIGSLAVMSRGDYEGYPTRSKLEEYLNQYKMRAM